MSDADDLKAKMREALDKKARRNHASDEGAEHDGSEKSHGSERPISQPEFRRKAT